MQKLPVRAVSIDPTSFDMLTTSPWSGWPSDIFGAGARACSERNAGPVRIHSWREGAKSRRSNRWKLRPARSLACWLTQETIVFNGARLERELEIDMTSTSRLVALESTVFGRRAMGETVAHARISVEAIFPETRASKDQALMRQALHWSGAISL